MRQIVKSCTHFWMSKHVCKRYCPCDPSLCCQKATLCVHWRQPHAEEPQPCWGGAGRLCCCLGWVTGNARPAGNMQFACALGPLYLWWCWAASERVLERSWWSSLCIMSAHGCGSTKKYEGELQEAKHNILIGRDGKCSITAFKAHTMRDPLCV